MADAIDLVIDAVCRLPIDYVQLGTFSAAEVVRRSGYGPARDRVTIDRIEACLVDHPEWVDAWFHWSDENRGIPAWFVRRSESSGFRVGRKDHGGESESLWFDDRTAACAEYVRREVDSIWRLL